MLGAVAKCFVLNVPITHCQFHSSILISRSVSASTATASHPHPPMFLPLLQPTRWTPLMVARSLSSAIAMWFNYICHTAYLCPYWALTWCLSCSWMRCKYRQSMWCRYVQQFTENIYDANYSDRHSRSANSCLWKHTDVFLAVFMIMIMVIIIVMI